jgi:hypothetical protein
LSPAGSPQRSCGDPGIAAVLLDPLERDPEDVLHRQPGSAGTFLQAGGFKVSILNAPGLAAVLCCRRSQDDLAWVESRIQELAPKASVKKFGEIDRN